MLDIQFSSDISHLSVVFFTFVLIFVAELGDKSQLVTMSLASKYRPFPVLMGVSSAFVILNLLAVTVGEIIATWIPELWLALLVAGLFLFFGVSTFVADEDEEDDSIKLSTKSIFISAFLMIFIAEFGDKTQLSVAGLAVNYHAITVWLGATAALLTSTVLSVFIGSQLLKFVSARVINKVSGSLFIIMALAVLYKLIEGYL